MLVKQFMSTLCLRGGQWTALKPVYQWHHSNGNFQCPLAWNCVTGRPVSELSTGTDPLWDVEWVDRKGAILLWALEHWFSTCELGPPHESGGVSPDDRGSDNWRTFTKCLIPPKKRKRRNNTINASKVINKLYHKTWSNIGQIVIYRQVHCLTQSFRVNQATSSTSKYKTSGIRSLQNKSTSIDCYRGGRDSPPEFARCTMTINS